MTIRQPDDFFRKNHPKKVLFEYSKITDQIYVGSNLCCQAHFVKELIKKGIRADISLEEKTIDAPYGAEYYLWLPVKDKDAPSFKQFDAGIKFLHQLIENKEKVYVHCLRGHGRAPTLVAAYLAVAQRMKLDRAIALLQEKRPSIHLTDMQRRSLQKFLDDYAVRRTIL